MNRLIFFLLPLIAVTCNCFFVWLMKMLLVKSLSGKAAQPGGRTFKLVEKMAGTLMQDAASTMLGNFNLQQEMAQPEYFEKIKPYIEQQVDEFLRVKLVKRNACNRFAYWRTNHT